MRKPGLREIKKEATAHALADAAFELALERGLDGFTIEDVVQLAVYSRRTFANHFSCKEEAVATAALCFKNTQEAENLMARLPRDTSPLDVMYHLMKMQLTVDHFRKIRELASLSRKNPSLVPYILNALQQLKISARQNLNQFSSGHYSEEHTHLLVGAVYGAMMPLYDGSLKIILPDDDPSEVSGAIPYNQFLDTVFNYLRNGFYKSW
ncbi:TetR/AcrR family transcriptional regulator [Halobacillus sp. MO56]